MSDREAAELAAALTRIKSQAATGLVRVTQHAQQEMVAEEVSLDEVLQAIERGKFWSVIPNTGVALAACWAA
jgi:hypothetical protein